MNLIYIHKIFNLKQSYDTYISKICIYFKFTYFELKRL